MNQQDSIIFATLFTYDATGVPMWLVASDMALQSDGSYAGALYQAAGPPFNRTPWGGVNLTQVGQMVLQFSSDTTGTLAYNIGQTQISKPIQKQVFSTPTSCVGMSGSRAALTNYQDLWWNPQESGWGINFAHQGNIIFATLFTYDDSGKDLWLVASRMDRQSNGSFAGSLYSVSGPALGASWTSVASVQVGSMAVAFASGEAGTLTYSYNGVSVTKSIKRQVFGSVLPFCQ